MVDASDAIQGPANWKMVKDMMVSLVKQIDISPNTSRVGVSVYGFRGFSAFPLSRYSTQADVIQAINNLFLAGGPANMSAGIEDMLRNQFTAANGDRAGVPNAAVVLAAAPSIADPRPIAKAAQNAGVKIFSVAMTPTANMAEVTDISSSPKTPNKNYFNSTGFAALNTVVAPLKNELCSPIVVSEYITMDGPAFHSTVLAL